MMKMQESLFRNLFDSLLTNVNSRIDGVIKDLAELKSSLQFTQKDVEDLKPVTKQMTKIVLRLTKDFSQTCKLSNRKMSFCSHWIGKEWEEVLRSSSREKGLVPQQDQKHEPGLTD